jgi:hypothetical protein
MDDRIVDDVRKRGNSDGRNACRHRDGHQEDFALAPAHAHLNLVGGVLLFLFGLYYRLIPAAGTSTLAKVQGWLHIIGAIALPIGVAIVIVKGEALVAIPIVGSLIVTAASAVCRDRVPDRASLSIGGHFLSPTVA